MNDSMKKWLFVLAVLCASCTRGDSALQDGYYTAEAAEFDAHGWKEYVTICVWDGQISLVEYNAFNRSGFIKSWDMDYMRAMEAVSGTYPNAYTRYYEGKLLMSQGIGGVDVLSGATESYRTFLRLADAAIENASRGNTETRLVMFGNNDHEENAVR
jgi:major membrane immunogen (membrane-anchored lipoprotein)